MTATKPTRHGKPRPEPAQVEIVPDERRRWAEHDACFTPRPVARQQLTDLRTRFGLIGCRVLDLGAGSGAWCAEARDILRPSLIVAVEPRAEELPHLQRWADQVHTMDAATFHDFAASHGAIGAFDLVLGNPPWWCWPEIWRVGWSVLDRTGVLSFLGPSSWGHSHEAGEGREIFEQRAPLLQNRVARRVAYNGGRGTDNRKCSHWVWHRSRSGLLENGWVAHQLPDMGPNAYHWDRRPGTEDP